MNTATPTPSERLLEEVRKTLKSRRVTLYRLADDIACNYISVYYAFNPEKKTRKRVGRPRFTYDFGKKLEAWLKNN